MFRIRYSILSIALLATGISTSLQAQSWQADILRGYSQLTIQQPRDYAGEVVTTLIRRDSLLHSQRAVLYIHGYNDYFLQSALGDSINRHGYAFYALDLRRYGRSLRLGQEAFRVRELSEYYADISQALQRIKDSGAEDVVLMAHSTGGLIATRYLQETGNKDSLQALVLNSPFFDFNFSKGLERFVLPVLYALGRPFPRLVAAAASKQPELYAQSLLKQYHGKWDYNTSWKKDKGQAIRLEWLRAIRRGHKALRQAAPLQLPILLMSSDSSLRASGAWQERFGRADLVLDVEDIQHYGAQLGPHVQAVRIADGLHDLFLSTSPQAYDAAYAHLLHFLDLLAKHNK